MFPIAGDLWFARHQATGREKRGQAAFSFPAMQRTGKGFDQEISEVIRAELLRAQDLKLPSWLVWEPSSSAGTTGCIKVVRGMEDKWNKGEEELN